MGRDPDLRLLLITDRTQVRSSLTHVCRSALAAGFSAVMIREKDLEGQELLDLATPLASICREFQRPFLVNDRIDVALALSGAGAHIGSAGMELADARRLLGRERILGYSAHEVAEAGNALDQGADYVTLSPVFASRSKPDLFPRGIRFLEEAMTTLHGRPVLALGGIEPENLGAIKTAGAHGAAVMGTMMRAEDPLATARELVMNWSRESG